MIGIPCPVCLREKGFSLQHECDEDESYLRAYFIAENLPVVAGLPWDETQKKCLLSQQFELQHHSYARQFSDSAPLVLRKSDTPVGRLYLAQDDSGLHIVDILLAKNWRGQGIGTALMQGVQASAFSHHLPVILSVDRLSAYSEFYRKLGFVIFRTDDILWTMRWPNLGTPIHPHHATDGFHGFPPPSEYAKAGKATARLPPLSIYETDPEPEMRNRGFLPVQH